MDGTIVDTEPYWFAAESALVASHGGSWTEEDGMTLVGAGLWHSARVLQGRGVDLSEEQLIDNLTSRVLDLLAAEMPWRPGARELLVELKAAGIPTALVTMSIRRMADHIVSAIDFPAFDVIVAGDEVTHSKPHPEAYLRAAELLGVRAEDCVALEDSEPGLSAAKASGAVSIGIPFMAPVAEGIGHELWPTLSGRTLHHLSTAFQAGRSS